MRNRERKRNSCLAFLLLYKVSKAEPQIDTFLKGRKARKRSRRREKVSENKKDREREHRERENISTGVRMQIDCIHSN